MADDVARLTAEMEKMRLALEQAEQRIAQAKQDAARAKQDAAQAEQDAAQAEQDAARAKQDAARAKQDAARAKQDAARAEKERQRERERPEAQFDRGAGQLAVLVATVAAAAAEDMAKDIADDIHIACNLADQQRRIGKILIGALPMNRADAPERSAAILASEMLPYEGDFHAFSKALLATTEGREQLQHVVAVTQTSGSGKTKLAYAEGTSRSLVVFIRVVKQSGSFTPAWKRYIKLVQDWADVRLRLNPADQRRVSESALATLRLLVVSYVQWVAAVLEAYRRVCPASVRANQSDLAANCRQVALRCLRNRRGDGAVGRIFDAALEQFAETVTMQPVDGDVTPVTVRAFDDVHVKEWAAKTDHQLRSLLWSNAEVIVWYDEAQQLMGTPAVFMTQSVYSTDGAVDHTPTDVLDGLTALMASLTDAQMWKQVVCGPFLELSDHLQLSDFSCVRGRMTSVHHASVITLNEMESSLRRHFDLGQLPPDVAANLTKLAGRPVWFFDGFWPALWTELKAAWTSETQLTREELHGFIDNAAVAALDQQTCYVCNMVKQRWADKNERSNGHSPHKLCKELYLALKLNYGQVSVSRDSVGTAIRLGLLALQPAAAEQQINLWNEPILATELERWGNNAAFSWHPASDPSLPPTDPIYSLLKDYITVDSVAQLQLTTSIKGPIFQQLFAWHVLRTVTILRDSTTLADILEPLLPRNRGVPPIVAGLRVRARFALSGEQARLASSRKLEFDFLADAAHSDKLVVNIDKDAGADIAFCAVNIDTGKRVLVLVQAKARESTSLNEAVRGATPAWQYTLEPQRKALLSGDWTGMDKFESPDKRRAFEALAQEQPHFLASAVRVVLSVNGFQDKSYEKCTELMDDYDGFGMSPVVLCSSTWQAFGGELHTRLLAECQNSGHSQPVSHPRVDTFWYPYSVQAIADASTARTALITKP